MNNLIKTLCCFTTDCCKGQCLKMSRNQNIKFTYNVFIIASYLLTFVILLFFGNYKSLQSEYKCNQHYISNAQDCVNQEIAFKVLFVLSVIFLILGSLMFLRSEKAKIINEGCWLLKVLFLVIGSVLITEIISGPLYAL